MKKIQFISATLSILSILAGCQKSDLSAPTSTDITADILLGKIDPAEFIVPENFVEGVTNPYFPLNVGDTMFFVLTGFEDGVYFTEESYIAVTPDVKVITGINCVVVRDAVFQDGIIAEDTYDWYAEDKFGNLWYLGEDTKKYADDGSFSTVGSFEHGIDGATGGIQMLADPGARIGHQYQQENYPGFAVDRAKIVNADATVTIGLGTFTGCLQIAETSPLAPGILGYKYYYPGLGQVFSITTVGPEEEQELVSTSF